jgi:hypothetical protein
MSKTSEEVKGPIGRINIYIRLPPAFEKINKVNAVFLQERYSIFPHLSARRIITYPMPGCPGV